MIEALNHIPQNATRVAFESPAFLIGSGVEAKLKARGTKDSLHKNDVSNLDIINAMSIHEHLHEFYFQNVDAGHITFSGTDSFQPSVALDPKALFMTDGRPFGKIDNVKIGNSGEYANANLIKKVLGNTYMGNYDRDILGRDSFSKPSGEGIVHRLVLAQHFLGRKIVDGDVFAFSYRVKNGKLTFAKPGTFLERNGVVVRVVKKSAAKNSAEQSELRWAFHREIQFPDNAVSLDFKSERFASALKEKNELLGLIGSDGNVVAFSKGNPTLPSTQVDVMNYVNNYRAVPDPLQRGMIFEAQPEPEDGKLREHGTLDDNFEKRKDMNNFAHRELDFSSYHAKFGNSPKLKIWMHHDWLGEHGTVDEAGDLRPPEFPFNKLIDPKALSADQLRQFKASRQGRRQAMFDGPEYKSVLDNYAKRLNMTKSKIEDLPSFTPEYLKAREDSISS